MPTRVVNCRHAPFDVYVGRPSKWGNPFSHVPSQYEVTVVPTREEAVRRYIEWVMAQPGLLAALEELRGRVLGCWCAPELCHGEVLAYLADTMEVESNTGRKSSSPPGGR